MIELVGVGEGKEYEAAQHLRKQLLAVWPDLSQHPQDHVKIFVGLKLYGHPIEDIDLFVVGQFSEPRQFDIEFKFYPREGEPFVPRRASVRNFALVIEAKSHDATGVRFDDKVASVRYPRGWECVTEKARQQVFELKRYLARNGVPKIYLQDLIFFSGLAEVDLPKRPHNCFGIDTSFERILNVLGQVSSPVNNNRNVTLSFGSEEVFNSIFSQESTLLQTMEPTPLDRRRMDRIVKAALPEAWLDDLMRKQIVFRGRGGVGKTVLLLQMAYRAYDSNRMRSLVLTYNKALVADMRRTMALLGVPHQIGKGGIRIDTVHAFIGRLMHELGIITTYDDFLTRYEEHKDTLLNYIRSGALSSQDLANLLEKNTEEFSWELIFIDEGQDWPTNEIEILRAVYPPEHIVVADGVDQYVRASVADWSSGLAREQLRPRRLRRCLRMKANLAHFVQDCAKSFGLQNWDLEPNPDANGGRVIIVEGDMATRTALLNQTMEQASKLGNYPVDLLACVPPSLVVHEDEHAYSIPGHTIQQNGGAVWDASSIDVREFYPTERDALRIVQYDSCRGLEGWAVINYAIDDLYDYKREQWLALSEDPGGLFETREELAANYAAQWLMIPLTRAMDTIVVNVTNRPSVVKDALRGIYNQRTDFIEWLKI
ncbi:AAA family ATPase [Thalassospira sp. ER-Se-21-Dark]|uniref:AAA family ATPase n=1 Tax=Thalassospira sp. ER-Se-21-Dark TaxID=2585190 RepID=UPI001B30FE50|nr:AAA family ATPase [Thalassospira sp. ER-Se-21-Dark]MBP3124754.1 RNA helicase [Thalassospira sp. ER-Se-21-Dark]